MRPKGKLFALFAVFAAIGLVTASGAFTSVQADRTAEVNVAGDANALLAIQPTDTQNGNAYAQINGNNQMELSLNGGFAGNNNPDGQGVNANATTTVDSVINVTNQGSQTVYLHIEPNGANSGAISFVNSTDASTDVDNKNMTGSGNAKSLSPGVTANISIYIDTDSSFPNNDEIISNVTIVADQTDS